MINLKSKKGFAILYAVLLTTIILTVAMGIGAIIAKQIVLTSIDQGSQSAYHAAVSTLECSLFYYSQGSWGSFDDADGDGNYTWKAPTSANDQITCSNSGHTFASNDASAGIYQLLPNGGKFNFSVLYKDAAGNNLSCARVEMSNSIVDPTDPATAKWQATTTGYNLVDNWDTCTGYSNPRTTERQIYFEK